MVQPPDLTGGTTRRRWRGSTLVAVCSAGDDGPHGRGSRTAGLERPVDGDGGTRARRARPHAGRLARHDRGRRARERRVRARRRRVRDHRCIDRSADRQPDRLVARGHRTRRCAPLDDRRLRRRWAGYISGVSPRAGHRRCVRDWSVRADRRFDGLPVVLLPERHAGDPQRRGAGNDDHRTRTGPHGGGGPMTSSSRARRAAWIAWGVTAGLLVIWLPLVPLAKTQEGDLVPMILLPTFVLGFATVGALITSRQPTNRIGLAYTVLALA